MANSGKRWTTEEDWSLWRQRYLDKCNIEDLAARFGRTYSGIASRLEHLTDEDHPACKILNDNLSPGARLMHLMSVYKDDGYMLYTIDFLLGRLEDKYEKPETNIKQTSTSTTLEPKERTSTESLPDDRIVTDKYQLILTCGLCGGTSTTQHLPCHHFVLCDKCSEPSPGDLGSPNLEVCSSCVSTVTGSMKCVPK